MARACTVCTHQRRKAINAALLSGTPVTAVAAKHGLAKSSVERHRSRHLENATAQMAEAKATERATAAIEATAQASTDVEANVRALFGRALKWLDEPGAKMGERAQMIRAANASCELLAKLSGRLGTAQPAPLVVVEQRSAEPEAPPWVRRSDERAVVPS